MITNSIKDNEGIAHKKQIIVDQIRYIGKESNNLEETFIFGIDNDSRRRIKIIDSLPCEESARKIIYLRIIGENDKFSGRTILGFNACKDDIMRTFDMRYP